jgi:hypothetical protein
MTSRREFLATLGLLLPLPAAAQTSWGVVHQLVGDVTIDNVPLTRNAALQAGQTIRTGADGRVWFSIGSDAYFLRPNSRLRLEASKPREPIIDLVRLFAGALGATFRPGSRRQLTAPTLTIGIRGTGVYLEATPEVAYFCTCFGSSEIAAAGNKTESVTMSATNHQARRIYSDARIVPAGFEGHTNEEIAELESMVGRQNPFRT